MSAFAHSLKPRARGFPLGLDMAKTKADIAEYNFRWYLEHKHDEAYRKRKSEYNAQYRKRHKAERQRYDREYYEAHKNEQAVRARRWFENNRDKASENNKKCYLKHKEERAQYHRQRYRSQRDKISERNRIWAQRHPEAVGVKNAARRSRINSAQCTLTKQQAAEILKSGCLFCHSKDNLTLAHDIPVSRKGSTARGNVFCLCKHCNDEMGTKTLGDILKQLSF